MFDTLWGQPAHPAAARTHGDVYAGFHLDGRPVASGEWPGARAVLNGEVIKDEVYELVQRDGRRVACGFAAGPIRDQNGQITGGVVLFRDVSEERRIQEALRHSEEKYRGLFEEMDEAYAVVEMIADASGRWTDFRFLEVNRPFMRHTGMPYPVGRTATDLLRNPNPRWAELYGRAADTGESVRLEEGEVTLGRVFDLNIFRLGGPGSRRIAVLFTDITERKRAELALQKGEQRRLVALDMAGIGDWAYDVASGELHCSARARAMHGVGPETRVEIELHDRLIHPDDRAAVQAARASALDPAGTGEYFMEFRFLPVDGTERLMQSMGRVIYEDTPDGRRAVQIIGAMIDVTHRLSVARHRGII
ncbi:PAS domain-containing protein [Pigmentiphaga litoralis]|uniref:PAS domain-containing protein n=1 Tax=Pigmentiphaga litoralis TaxID=516702 RepID=UPI003B436C93